MSKKVLSNQFVVIPEGIANLLDSGSRLEAKSLNFGFSNLDEDKALELPSPAEIDAIRYTSLSDKDLISTRRDGELNRTVYPAVRYFPQVVSLVAPSARGSTKAIKRPIAKTLQHPKPSVAWSVKVIDQATGLPIPNVLVYASPFPGRKKLIVETTDSTGSVTLQIPSGSIDELLVIPPHTQWSRVIAGIKPTSSVYVVTLDPLDLTQTSATHMAHGPAATNASGANVRVGVIDTGVGPHLDVNRIGGSAPQSDPGGTLDDCGTHGTHVAGIIAGNGLLKGFAPNCELFSYRVFKAGQKGALNGDIVVAIFAAVDDGCHLINLSLGAEKKDPLVEKALEFAMANGVLVVAASGNGSRKPLNFPASVPGVVSVSAVGCEGTYPVDSIHTQWECQPRGSTPTQYIAAFSNVGKMLCCTAPGVAVISTVPGGYSAMDGTSMAAPVVTGIAACLLSANSTILNHKPLSSRTDAMRSLLYAACNSLGFDPTHEGSNGLPS